MKKIYSVLLTVIFLHAAYAQSGVSLVSFSTGYTLPLGIENCGDNRLFIVQKTGQVIICDTTGIKTTTPYLDISDRITSTASEQGLLGLAFHPKYKTNGYLFVDYINKAGNTQISRFTVSSSDPNKADVNTEKKMLEIVQPSFTNHKGGCIRFGKDGFLYIAAGDGGSGGDPYNNAQNPATLLGKILRINVNTSAAYGIPASNPFVDSANYKKEIWALGVRNPWRFSFDDATGSLIIADVGQDLWEEVDLQNAKSKGGENYGWRCYEGNHAYNTSGCKPQTSYKSPVYEYPHSSVTGDCSITGGFVYRGKKYPALAGKYFFTDYCSGIMRTLVLKNNVATETDVYKGDQYAYTSFGQDKNKELYVTNYVTGGIYKIIGSSSVTAANTDALPVQMVLYPNPAHQTFSIKYSTAKAEECSITVYGANGKNVYTASKVSVAGDNVWNVALPSWVSGNCFVTVSSSSGSVIKQTIVIRRD